MARLIDADLLISTGENGVITELIPDFQKLSKETQNAVCDYAKGVKSLILNAPTVDAVPVVHGEWIEEHEDDEDGAMTIYRKWVRCSACKSVYSPNVRMNYCPNCGAKMDLEVKYGV